MRILLIALAMVAGCSRPEVPVAVVDLGKAAWKENCSACHFIPDTTLQSDRVWMEMLQTTS